MCSPFFGLWTLDSHPCSEMLVYKEGDPIYHSKMLTFYRKELFELEASYASPNGLPYPCKDIGITVDLSRGGWKVVC